MTTVDMNAIPHPRTSNVFVCGRCSQAWLRLAAALTIAAAGVSVAKGAMSTDLGISVASRIPSSPADAARPVAVIDREDIELSGMTNVHDLLADRSAYNGFGLHRPLVLGSGRAVFLIDGRRVPDPNASYVLEFLPVSAVERVEILSAGASALHAARPLPGRSTSC